MRLAKRPWRNYLDTSGEPSRMDNKYIPLANYNAEVARGLIHTDKWKEQMRKLQEEFNKEYNR